MKFTTTTKHTIFILRAENVGERICLELRQYWPRAEIRLLGKPALRLRRSGKYYKCKHGPHVLPWKCMHVTYFKQDMEKKLKKALCPYYHNAACYYFKTCMKHELPKNTLYICQRSRTTKWLC